jgi:uncharacterized surface protein with fasciclin (FAS1) repeats
MSVIGSRFRTLLTAAALTVAASAPAFAAGGTIYDKLKSDPQFSTLVKVIDANGVKYQYTAKSPRTVFAPTNAAFDAIKGGYDDMLSGSNESNRQNTQALLLYEIVPGAHSPASLEGKSTTINTFQKDPVTITGSGGKLHFGGDFGANQAGDAIEASNGIIIPVDTLPTPVFSQSDDTTSSTAPAAGTLKAPAQ